MANITRRNFLGAFGLTSVSLPLGSSVFDFEPTAGSGFHFMLLGDLHFDKLSHHDMEYVKAKYPNDIVQIENYSRITEQHYPQLLQTVKARAAREKTDFWLQLGDFVEGLCGSEALAKLQTEEFIESIRQLDIKRPFYVVKGNHDITGEGAPEVYKKTVLPWQETILKKKQAAANASFVYKQARFIIFDAYTPNESLEWLKTVLAKHKEKHLFFCIHMPVVPYNARSNWHIFARPEQQEKRNELLNLLGKHKAIVLSAHLHKTCILSRDTPEGRFVQVALGSVISNPADPVRHHLRGLDKYNEELVGMEPNFTPNTLELRKKNLRDEAPFIRHFEYADFCGYAGIRIDDAGRVYYSVYANLDTKPWSMVELTELLQD